jgi:phage tail-like protein
MSAPAGIVETSTPLALAVDHYNRYPGELVTFFLRFTAPEGAGAVLQFAMPNVLQVESYVLPEGIPISLPAVTEAERDLVVMIPLAEHFRAGQAYEITVRVRINAFYFDHYLLAEARLLTEAGLLALETVQVAVFGKGKYLTYLPELYGSDDFTSRFLMLFESFWKPINQQIDQVENYFDPDLTPEQMLPWLSSWIGMPVDPTLPVHRMRSLLRQAMQLFQCRGTLRALKLYLEIYTEGQVEVQERRANNFILGQGSALGAAIALGRANQPNSVSVRLRLPRAELARMGYSEAMYVQKMKEIIRGLIPAHVVFDVECVFYAEPDQGVDDE